MCGKNPSHGFVLDRTSGQSGQMDASFDTGGKDRSEDIRAEE